MSRRPLLTFAPELPAVALARLEGGGPLPAWLIDVVQGRILAATAAGAAMLGLSERIPPPLLDAATPALGRLRALADPGLPRSDAHRDDDALETLIFWTRNGPRRCDCRVAMMPAGEQMLAAVTAQLPDPQTDDAAQTASPLALDDDAAKLKEIARRIREGQLGRTRSERRRPDAPTSAAMGAASVPPIALAHAPETVAAPLRASLAHELKTPLSAIAAAAEVMKDQRLGPIGSPRYLGYAKDIHGTAQHALSVIERMLADGKDTSETPEDVAGDVLDFAEIDAASLLSSTVSELGVLAARAGLTLVLELDPRLPHLIADATSLRQIVLNLVTNAIKFTPAGGAVTVAARYDGDGPLTLVVSDTGTGMSADEVAHALGRGGRPRSSRKTKKTERAELGLGLGLGLPLVQKLAAANGGALSLDSTPGHGTRASVVFRKDRVVPV